MQSRWLPSLFLYITGPYSLPQKYHSNTGILAVLYDKWYLSSPVTLTSTSNKVHRFSEKQNYLVLYCWPHPKVSELCYKLCSQLASFILPPSVQHISFKLILLVYSQYLYPFAKSLFSLNFPSLKIHYRPRGPAYVTVVTAWLWTYRNLSSIYLTIITFE